MTKEPERIRKENEEITVKSENKSSKRVKGNWGNVGVKQRK